MQMYGCGCGCHSFGYGPRFASWPTRQERIERLEEYQRDLEQQAADVADEIQRLKEKANTAG
jgi:hypothetical protein